MFAMLKVLYTRTGYLPVHCCKGVFNAQQHTAICGVQPRDVVVMAASSPCIRLLATGSGRRFLFPVYALKNYTNYETK